MTRQALDVSIALSDNALTRPLIAGRVVPDGLRLLPTVVHPSEMFWRQLRFGEFDVSEMSLASLIVAISRGDRRWVGIPVYTMRRFFHTWILVRAAAGIEGPADLRGKRVGVPDYQQTSAIWSRGILQHEFGVAPHEITWFMERAADRTHAGAEGFRPPPGITVHQIPSSTNIGRMLEAGDLDATLLYLSDRNLVDRSRTGADALRGVRPLFPDVLAEGRRYFAKTGLYPINHIVVVKRDVFERHPWIALNLYTAFERAKAELTQQRQDSLRPYIEVGAVDGLESALREDPMAYGVRAARPVLETVARYVHEQGLTDRQVVLEDIFAPSTMEL